MRGLPQKRHFNPRTREGCDAITRAREKLMYVFQSTHPWRVRLPLSLLIDAADGISIHAPVKGATHGTAGPPAVAPDFNPRTREGCDVKLLSTLALARLISIHAPVKGATLLSTVKSWFKYLFQSTHPWRVRQKILMQVLTITLYFNPRTREGCDWRLLF